MYFFEDDAPEPIGSFAFAATMIVVGVAFAAFMMAICL
jgi:multisubunit Na+/H+ antiporter MnhC subunit